ncbi:MAG: hypothetical protein IIC49_04715 [Planctomycetes bacterium]|nr:hypothetical protein [Planctomycetota bacterium]
MADLDQWVNLKRSNWEAYKGGNKAKIDSEHRVGPVKIKVEFKKGDVALFKWKLEPVEEAE